MPASRRARALAPALLVALLVSGCESDGAGTTDAGTTSSSRTPNGTEEQVGTVTDLVVDWTDTSRTTDPTPDSPGNDAVQGRDLPTRIWYPTDGAGPFPVVVFSHGFGSSPGAYFDLIETWAAAGYVVAAPTFPLTSEGSALVDADLLNQPADVSFVLTQVLALEDEDGDELAGRIDTTRIAFAGHSVGAITTLGLLDTCCQDPRATAAMVLSGSAGVFDSPVAGGVPTLFVHGTADDVLPIAGDLTAYGEAAGPKAFVQLPGGTHSSPYDDSGDPWAPAVQTLTTDFLRWALSGDAGALTDLRAAADSPGLTETVDDRWTA